MLVSGIAFSAYSQSQLPNVGYESWQNVGNNDEEPTNMNSNKTGGGLASLGPQTCYRATSPNTGSYCTELRTRNYLGTAVNGTATTGKVQAPSTNPSDGYIETLRSDADFNWPFSSRPDSLVGYYKYLVAGGDQGKVQVYLHGDYDVRNPLDAGSIPYVIAQAKFLTPNASVPNWTRFSVPFTYTSGSTPNYALVVCTASSESATAVNGSKMWIDDVQVVYAPLVAAPAPSESNIRSYWSDDDLVIDLGTTLSGVDRTLQLYDLNGKLELEAVLQGPGVHRMHTDLAAGIYLLRLVGADEPYAVKMAKVE
jgi:hypothetical protein